MKIVFSRHAKRRMKLYGIEKDDVIRVLSNVEIERLSPGKYDVVSKLNYKYVYPLKIIFMIENGKLIVITIYPIKKKRRNKSENLL